MWGALAPLALALRLFRKFGNLSFFPVPPPCFLHFSLPMLCLLGHGSRFSLDFPRLIDLQVPLLLFAGHHQVIVQNKNTPRPIGAFRLC